MKVTELQIGDLVMYNGCVCRVYCIQSPLPRRDRLSDKSVITLFLNGLIDASEGEIEPIPLTPEILEKNVFVRVNTQRYEWTGSIGYYVKVNPKKKMWHINGANGSNVNQYFLIVNFNVNLFQHALRLCGLNDLADNFKI